MTEKKRIRRNELYEDYKLAYVALMLFYPFGLEDLDGEVWKKIGFGGGNYEISNYGRVKSFHKGKVKILKPSLHDCGYLYVELYERGKCRKCKIHRLVAEGFIPNPENKPTVDHILNNKFDNFVGNLRWATMAENNQYAYDTEAKKSAQDSYQSKLTNEQVIYCRKVYDSSDKKFNLPALAKQFGVALNTMSKIISGKTYKNVR